MKLALISILLIASITAAQEPKKNEKLSKLTTSYESAVEKATAPLRKTYLGELTRLKSELERAKDAAGVAEVDALITEVTSGSDTSGAKRATRLKQLKTPDDILRWLAGTEWQNVDGDWIKFTEAGKLRIKDLQHPLPEGFEVSISCPSVGIIAWSWSGGGNLAVTAKVSDDLKVIQMGGRKDFKRTKP